MPKIMLSFSREELNRMQYPVLVEMWDEIKGSYSRRRKYCLEFTKTERKTISIYYTIFYQWYLVKGTPENHTMKTKTYNLLNRAIEFFASH